MTTLASLPLRLPKSIKAEAERQSPDDGTSLNQFIAIAIAEKIAARQTAAFFEVRAKRATGTVLWDLLDRTGGEPPRAGDELPEGYVPLPRGHGAAAQGGAAKATKAPPKRRRTAGGPVRR